MMAVFSDSTRATVLSGCWGRRCSPKNALGELPVFGELMAAFEGCVEPVDSAGDGFVFYAFAG